MDGGAKLGLIFTLGPLLVMVGGIIINLFILGILKVLKVGE